MRRARASAAGTRAEVGSADETPEDGEPVSAGGISGTDPPHRPDGLEQRAPPRKKGNEMRWEWKPSFVGGKTRETGYEVNRTAQQPFRRWFSQQIASLPFFLPFSLPLAALSRGNR